MTQDLNRSVAAELDLLVMQKVLTPAQARAIAERYPTSAWDLLVLARWFTILGAVTAVAGLVILANEFVNIMRLGEVGLLVAFVALIALGRWTARAKSLVKTGAALEMAAGFALQGLTVLLAVEFCSGSKNWPALIGAQALLLAALAYALQNRLVLIHAAVCFFVYFGGETGYMSGWSAYWLSMTCPLRFLAAGFVFLGVAWIHAAHLRPYQFFARVYGHLGLLVVHLSLWFLAIFGFFEDQVRRDGTEAQRLAFSALWAAVSIASLLLSGTTGFQMLRSYGLTFLIVDVYCFYFQFVVARSPQFLFVHLLLVGCSLAWLGFALEKRRRRQPS